MIKLDKFLWKEHIENKPFSTLFFYMTDDGNLLATLSYTMTPEENLEYVDCGGIIMGYGIKTRRIFSIEIKQGIFEKNREQTLFVDRVLGIKRK